MSGNFLRFLGFALISGLDAETALVTRGVVNRNNLSESIVMGVEDRGRSFSAYEVRRSKVD